MKFITKNSSHSALHISFKEKHVYETVNTNFLGLRIDNHINWQNHNEQMIPKLSGACYALRLMAHISYINTVKSIYSAYFHYIIKYGIIFWDNFSNSGKIFTLQNKIFRIVTGA
jgi:hypothetical protein